MKEPQIRFRNLSWPLKAAAVYSWFIAFVWAAMFLFGVLIAAIEAGA